VLGRVVPTVIHGYDYPVPDGRGYMGGLWVLPGPWLAPGFRKKGYEDSLLQLRCELMTQLIDRFNSVIQGIAGKPGLGHLHYLDLRGTLPKQTAGGDYKRWWNDELHPTERGFHKIAIRFDRLIRSLT
jgi:hypothetical protein